MKIVSYRSLAVLVAIVVLGHQISPVVAGQARDARAAGTQGSRFPGLPEPANVIIEHSKRPVEIAFTKWITVFPNLQGVVEGPVNGVFAGEVLNAKPTTNPAITSITSLEAVYEVQAGPHSFTALLRGGQSNVNRTAVLDGVILHGWRIGAQVHVEFDIISTCDGKPAGPCFKGTIRILPSSGDRKD